MKFTRFFPLIAAGLLAAAGSHAADGSANHGKKALFVLQKKTSADGIAADAKVKERLESLGFSVDVADQADPATAANGKNLVVISSTVSANALEGKYAATTVPVVTWESYILPHMGMTGQKLESDFGTQKEKVRYVSLINAPHPLAAGLPAGMLNIVQEGAPLNWGKPALAAIVISTIAGDPSRVTEFAYEKGATMDHEMLAPARRVSLFLENATFTNLNDAGLKLFDAAVTWAAAQPAAGQ